MSRIMNVKTEYNHILNKVIPNSVQREKGGNKHTEIWPF